MEDNVIKLKESDVLRLRIQDKDGNDTGNYLEFNLADIELSLRYQEIIELDKKNRANVRNQFAIIEKQQDHKDKKLLSFKEEQKIKILQNFYKEEVKIYNMFLGENGVQKLLNGRELSWTTLNEIDDIIKETILPKLKVNAEDIKQKIMNKYAPKQEETLE
jgi:hypothetical protein